MKTSRTTPRHQSGGTMVDLLVIGVVIIGVAVIFLPALARPKVSTQRIRCINNLKQVAMGLLLFANDNDGRYPLEQISGGTDDSARGPTADGWTQHPTNLWKLFQLAENDISSARILVCPADTWRIPAHDFLTAPTNGHSSESFSHSTKRNNALSYFLALDAKEAQPAMLLVGDRNLARDSDKSDSEPGRNCLTGEQRLGSTADETKHLRWNNDIHERGGNIAFMDGSAQQLTSGKLRDALGKTGDTNNRIWLPQ